MGINSPLAAPQEIKRHLLNLEENQRAHYYTRIFDLLYHNALDGMMPC